jgi:hypothetical protein
MKHPVYHNHKSTNLSIPGQFSNPKARPNLTKNQILLMAAFSIRVTGGLNLFWNRWNHIVPASPSYAETRQILADNNALIFNKGNRITSDNSLLLTYETESWGSGHKEGSQLYNWHSKVINKSPLISIIPNHLDLLLRASGGNPDNMRIRVHLLKYETKTHDDGSFQNLFKVLVEYLNNRNQGTQQLFIMGTDRHTKQPFALGIPNGFVDQSIETCLRWTMNLHKGDTVHEV